MIGAIKNKIENFIKNPLTKQEKKLLKELKSYELTDECYKQYIKWVKGNTYTSKDLAKKKLIRNIVLGEMTSSGTIAQVYKYGNLDIYMDSKHKDIFAITNCKVYSEWDKDKVKYEFLNMILHIEDN